MIFKWRELYCAYANLFHRQDRNEHMQNELHRVGLNAERFESINTKGDEWNRFPYQKMFERTRGAIGCMLSQMTIMQKAYDMGKGAMVFEDDLVFASDTLERLDYIENYVNTKEPNADVIFLGGTVHKETWWHGEKHEPMLEPYCKCTLKRDLDYLDDEHMIRVYGMFSTHAYIAPYEKIPKILTLLNQTMPITIGIDFSFIIHEPNLICLAFLPGTVKQIDNMSDIGSGMTVFSNFANLGSHWWADKL